MCLFPAANGALFAEKNWGLGLRLVVAAAYRSPFLQMISYVISKYVNAFLWRRIPEVTERRKKVSLQLSSEQSTGDVRITQLDWKRGPQGRSRGCKSSVAITTERRYVR